MTRKATNHRLQPSGGSGRSRSQAFLAAPVESGRSSRKETAIPQISAITAEQRERIPEFRRKWLDIAQSVDRIDPTRTQDAIEQIYAELQVGRLDEFLVVSSPVEALQQFNAWNTRVGRYLNCLWNYQLPLCDPTAYWRKWGIDRDQIHFASRREPNKHRCYSLLIKGSPKPSVTLGKDLHHSLWVDFRPPPRRDWCVDVTNELWKRFPVETERMEIDATSEDPTCQATVDEFIFLGPFVWLVHEVACVDFCHSVLGIPRNAAIYEALESLLQFGSLVITFENLCIICDRPTMIEPRIVFSDGTTFV